MYKPTENDLQIAAEVLEYVIADLEANESYAINSIHCFKEALSQLPCASDLGDLPDAD